MLYGPHAGAVSVQIVQRDHLNRLVRNDAGPAFQSYRVQLSRLHSARERYDPRGVVCFSLLPALCGLRMPGPGMAMETPHLLD